MSPGDLFWVEFPPGAGRAQAGRRPAIVVQTADASAKLPTVLVVPLTSKQDALRFPGTILIHPDAQNGLRHASVALAFQVAAIDRRFLGSKLGSLSDTDFAKMWAAFDQITRRT